MGILDNCSVTRPYPLLLIGDCSQARIDPQPELQFFSKCFPVDWLSRYGACIQGRADGVPQTASKPVAAILTSDLLLWLLQESKTWISSGCTQSCTCRGGAVQCQDFKCPVGTHCQHSVDGSSHCASDGKEAVEEGRGYVLMHGRIREKARRKLVLGGGWRQGGHTVHTQSVSAG